MVQGQRRETGEAKVQLAIPDGSLVGHNDGLLVAGGPARVDDSDGEEQLDIGVERRAAVGLVWCAARASGPNTGDGGW